MEELDLKLSAQEINSKEFTGKNGGYDALQVDKYLDLIEKFVNNYKKTISDYEDLKKLCDTYKDKLSESEYQRALIQEKLDVLRQNVSTDLSNIELLQRISVLEQAIYKLGKDPSKIK